MVLLKFGPFPDLVIGWYFFIFIQTLKILLVKSGDPDKMPYSLASFFVWFDNLNIPVNSYHVMLGRSVHLTTLFFWASLTEQLTSTYLPLNETTLLETAEGRSIAVEIIS